MKAKDMDWDKEIAKRTPNDRQRDYLLVKALSSMLKYILWIDRDEDIYVFYKPNMCEVELKVDLDALDDYQLRRLYEIAEHNEHAIEGRPSVEVNIWTRKWDAEKVDMVDMVGKFELEIKIGFTEEDWMKIMAMPKEEEALRRKAQKKTRKPRKAKPKVPELTEEAKLAKAAREGEGEEEKQSE